MMTKPAYRTAGAAGLALLLGWVAGACGPRTGGAVVPARDSLCAGIDNSYACAREVESARLARLDGRVVRHGDTLAIAVSGGDTVRLVDRDTGGPGNRFFSYRRHLDEVGYHLVDVHFYEGGSHLLIDDDTGERTSVSAPPVVSPDGARLVVASAGGEAGYAPDELQVWRVTPDGLALEWQIQPDDWGATDARWQDPSTVRFRKSRWCPDGSGICTEEAVLRKRSGGWRLEPATGGGGQEVP